MSPISSPIVSLALRLLLANRLQKTLDLLQKVSGQPEIINNLESFNRTTSTPRDISLLSAIPLNRVSGGTKTSYASAIALKLANQWQQTASSIAEQIASHLSNSINISSKTNQTIQEPPHLLFNPEFGLERVWQYFAIEVTPPGWIHFHLSERGLAEWLQLLVYCSSVGSLDLVAISTQSSSFYSRDSTRIFLILYTHARCCTLIRLAIQTGLIQFDPSNPSAATVQWSRSTPFPCLVSNHTFCYQHPLESRLIAQVQTILDDLSCPTSSEPTRYWKHAEALSQAFQTFYAMCRIWGEVKTTDRAMAQSRLGLVLITQILLRSLLEDGLGIPAPSEL